MAPIPRLFDVEPFRGPPTEPEPEPEPEASDPRQLGLDWRERGRRAETTFALRVADHGGFAGRAEEGRSHDFNVDFPGEPLRRVQVKFRSDGVFNLAVRDTRGRSRLAMLEVYALTIDGQTFYLIPRARLADRTSLRITGKPRRHHARDHFDPEHYLEAWRYLTGNVERRVNETPGMLRGEST